MDCIKCKSKKTYFDKKKQAYICEDCGFIFEENQNPPFNEECIIQLKHKEPCINAGKAAGANLGGCDSHISPCCDFEASDYSWWNDFCEKEKDLSQNSQNRIKADLLVDVLNFYYQKSENLVATENFKEAQVLIDACVALIKKYPILSAMDTYEYRQEFHVLLRKTKQTKT